MDNSKQKKKIDQKIKEYFNFFSKKNLKQLDKMFSNDVELIDWNVRAKGKKKVLEINKKIFENKKINLIHYETYYNFFKKIAACKIQVVINNKKLNVVDLIQFDKNLKIKKIIAYLR